MDRYRITMPDGSSTDEFSSPTMTQSLRLRKRISVPVVVSKCSAPPKTGICSQRIYPRVDIRERSGGTGLGRRRGDSRALPRPSGLRRGRVLLSCPHRRDSIISVSVLSSADNEFAEIVVWRARPLRSARARNWCFPVSVASHSAGSSRPPVVERSHEPWMPG